MTAGPPAIFTGAATLETIVSALKELRGRHRLNFVGSHIISVDQFDRSAADRIFEVADKMQPMFYLLANNSRHSGCYL